MTKSLNVMLMLALLGWMEVEPASAQVNGQGGVAVLAVQNQAVAGAGLDFVNAVPMALPRSVGLGNDQMPTVSGVPIGAPGFSAGAPGNGITHKVFLGRPAVVENNGITPQEYGTSNHPFSTARADLNIGGTVATNTIYPYSATGKLFFKMPNDSQTWVCSASLIKRGVVVTAAHCVAEFGQSQIFNSWQFVPGYRNGSAPFNTWTVAQAVVPIAYYNGSEVCYQSGVVCPDDIAVLLLNPQGGTYPGTTAGWYGYGWNNYGFALTGGYRISQISQLGYPGCLDNGGYMERNDSYGYVNQNFSGNTIIGSLMCGGSSGGPWLVNFGIRPGLTGTTAGTDPSPSTLVGVTSWGYTNMANKEMGASPFTSNNIVGLVNSACSAAAAACQ